RAAVFAGRRALRKSSLRPSAGAGSSEKIDVHNREQDNDGGRADNQHNAPALMRDASARFGLGFDDLTAVGFFVFGHLQVSRKTARNTVPRTRSAVREQCRAALAVPDFWELEHDPEKWKPVFGKDPAQTKG